MATALPDLGKMTELRQRLLFLLGALVVFRIGAHIPVPGIDPNAMAQLFDQQRGTILDMFNMFSGGALGRLSIFALGVMPYISASIILQLMSMVVPALEQLRKEGGAAGRHTLTRYTRYLTVVLASFQAIGVSIAIQGQMVGSTTVVVAPGPGFIVTATIT
jgi:preprotein translocase subunit SecY